MRLILILTALLAFQGVAASEFDDMKALAELGMAAAQFNLALMYDSCWTDGCQPLISIASKAL